MTDITVPRCHFTAAALSLSLNHSLSHSQSRPKFLPSLSSVFSFLPLPVKRAPFSPSVLSPVNRTTCRTISSLSLADHSGMSTGELLSIEPQELQFPYELEKQNSCSLQLLNKSESYVAFKVKTTNPKKYCVRPNTGVVLPRSTCDVIVTMQAQKEFPPDMQCKDKFLLQSVVASPGATAKDITSAMFNKEAGQDVEECKLRVVYVAPPRPPSSPVREGSEEGSSPRASVSDNGNLSASEHTPVSRAYVERLEPQESSSEARALISRLTEEKNSAILQNNKLQQELELLGHQSSQGRSGIPFMYVVLVGLVGIILGYFINGT